MVPKCSENQEVSRRFHIYFYLGAGGGEEGLRDLESKKCEVQSNAEVLIIFFATIFLIYGWNFAYDSSKYSYWWDLYVQNTKMAFGWKTTSL